MTSLLITQSDTITRATDPSGQLIVSTAFVAPSLYLFIFINPRTGNIVGVGSRLGNLYHLDYLHVSLVASPGSSVFASVLCI